MGLPNSDKLELLKLAARPALDGSAAHEFRRLARTVSDWPGIIRRAQEHSIFPLFHDHLESISAHDIPPDVLARARKLAELNATRVFALSRELIRWMQLFQDDGIEAVTFKGPTLAVLAYGNIALRQFADVDIIVRKSDVARARHLLTAYGFTPIPQLTEEQEAAVLRFDCAQNFRNRQNVTIDIHWNLVPRYLGISLTDDFWKRTRTLKVGRDNVRTLSHEDLLISLSIHGFTHRWERLGWVSDIAALISRPAIDWDLVSCDARRLGLVRILASALILAEEVLDARIPPEASKEIERDTMARKLAQDFVQNVFAAKPSHGYSPLELFRLRERLYDKLVTGIHSVTTPREFDWMWVSVPKSLSSAYYVVRPIRLGWKRCGKMARWASSERLRNGSATT